MLIQTPRGYPTCFQLVFALFCVGLNLQTAFAAGAFELISRGNDGSLAANVNSSDHSAITPDGRYVVFRSKETQFVSPQTSGSQIFLRDRLTGKTELISLNNQGEYGNGNSDWPSISNDGCRIVFESTASNLVATDSNADDDVFIRDRCSNPAVTYLISVNSSGTKANGRSRSADISGDGHTVVFLSLGTNLGAPEKGQIYKRDLIQQTTLLVSHKFGDTSKGGISSSYCPAVSDDGKRVAFWSYASNLVTDDTNAIWDIFLADTNGDIKLVSSDAAGIQQNQGGEKEDFITCPAISGDGRYVAFASRSTSLVAGDSNAMSDIFVKDTQDGGIIRASVSSTAVEGNADSLGRPALSLDGTWVVFASKATNLASETGGIAPNIIGHNRQTHATVGFARLPANDFPAISGDLDGRYITSFWLGRLTALNSTGIYVFDRNAEPGAVINQQPVADAGVRQTILTGETAVLDASASSDAEGVPMKFTWSQLSGPEQVTLTDAASAKPSFTPQLAGSYIFQLIVKDDSQDSLPNFTVVDVSETDSPPILVDAGKDRAANIGDPVNLKSRLLSIDPMVNKKKLKYRWVQLYGSKVKIKGKGKLRSFIPTKPGIYLFGLESSEGNFKSPMDTVRFDVNPSISVIKPTAGTTWTVGKIANIKWRSSGINPNRNLALIFSPDNGKSNYLLTREIKVGDGRFSFLVNQLLRSKQAVIALCLEETPTNSQVCGVSSSTFIIR